MLAAARRHGCGTGPRHSIQSAPQEQSPRNVGEVRGLGKEVAWPLRTADGCPRVFRSCVLNPPRHALLGSTEHGLGRIWRYFYIYILETIGKHVGLGRDEACQLPWETLTLERGAATGNVGAQRHVRFPGRSVAAIRRYPRRNLTGCVVWLVRRGHRFFGSPRG
jgi:hypothetical protein